MKNMENEQEKEGKKVGGRLLLGVG